MRANKVYIQTAEQISIQQPLSEQWMVEPVFYEELFVKAQNPSFRDYLAANEARRMSNIMKRALVTTTKVLEKTKIEHPDAIITGTSNGCLDYTEKFLDAMVDNKEQTLSPTYFMQSTHNTVGSAIGISTKTHGYNTTYSHGGISFDLAILDAWMQIQLGKISTALVGGHDEMVDTYFSLLQKKKYVGLQGMVPCSEVAMAMMLNTDKSSDVLCEIAGISICYQPSNKTIKDLLYRMLENVELSLTDISAILTGVNGNIANDKPYYTIVDEFFSDKPLLHYKHLFGENFTASALGLYAAAHILKNNMIPSFVYDKKCIQQCKSLHNILFLNHTIEGNLSIILLRKV